jgi:hypothetical protein
MQIVVYHQRSLVSVSKPRISMDRNSGGRKEKWKKREDVGDPTFFHHARSGAVFRH